MKVILYTNAEWVDANSKPWQEKETINDRGVIMDYLSKRDIDLETLKENGELSAKKLQGYFSPFEKYVEYIFVSPLGQFEIFINMDIYHMTICHYLLSQHHGLPYYHIFADLFGQKCPSGWLSFSEYAKRPTYFRSGDRRMAILTSSNITYTFAWTERFPSGEWGISSRRELIRLNLQPIQPETFYDPRVNAKLLLTCLGKHRGLN